MDDLLYLVHRIPYPPNKGDKIRSFHLLKHLSTRYRIYLGTLIDQPADRRYCDLVRQYCADAWFGNLSPSRAKLKSLMGLMTGEALTLPYYHHHGLVRWIRTLRRERRIQRVLIYSSAMAQYVMGSDWAGTRRVIDFVDVDSQKWLQYSTLQGFPMNWIYHREAERLGQYERRIAACFDASLFVSDQEAALFRQGLGETSAPVFAMSNGVDIAYFAPDPARPSPYVHDTPRGVLIGAMDYWANEDGATWFAHEVLPRIRRYSPGFEFYIVGMNPTANVRQLGRLPGVVVTGAVPDVRPYLQYAQVVVVPLRIARGIQNKVLEAMAMGRPVVTTTQALEGIPALVGRDLLVADEADAFSEQVRQILMERGESMGDSARDFVRRRFTWEASLPRIDVLLEGGA